MQKVINVLAVSSFLVSAAIVGGAGYLYVNKDSLIEQAREEQQKQQQRQSQEHFLV